MVKVAVSRVKAARVVKVASPVQPVNRLHQPEATSGYYFDLLISPLNPAIPTDTAFS